VLIHDIDGRPCELSLSVPFGRTLRSLDTEKVAPSAVPLAIGVVLSILWCGWFFGARVAIYEPSRSARLEVDAAPHPVTAGAAGRVVRAAGRVGEVVENGRVLFELDVGADSLERESERARYAGLTARLGPARLELEAARSQMDGERASGVAAVKSVEEEAAAAETAARLASQELGRVEELGRGGLAPPAQLQQARAEAERTRHTADARTASIRRAAADRDAALSRSRAEVERMRGLVADIEGQAAEAKAQIAVLDRRIADGRIVAPVTGRIAEVSQLRPGMWIEPGDTVATILPDGRLRAVAIFPPSALGRVRVGNEAVVRFEGFPWESYGTATATVAEVADEPRDGTIRAYLELRSVDPRIPVQHGLPVTLEVRVERISPARLALRAITPG